MKTTVLATLVLMLVGSASTEALDVKEFWKKNCANCHGLDGKGDTKMGKKLRIVNLSDPKLQEQFTDEQMFKAVKEGVKDEKGKVRMKPAEKVNDREIEALIAHVRTLKQQ